VLVILNGPSTLNRLELANIITVTANKLHEYKMGDYVVDFSDSFFVVKDKDGNVVHTPSGLSGENDGTDGLLTSTKPDDKSIFDKCLAFEEFRREYSKNNTFHNRFTDIHKDYNKGPATDISVKGPMHHQVTFFDLMKMYSQSQFKYYVITGSFGRDLIDNCVKELGANNVRVLNFIRHPSVCACLYRQDSDWYNENQSMTYLDNLKPYFKNYPNSDRGCLEFDNGLQETEFFSSVANTINIKTHNNVINFVWETVLSNGYFEFDGFRFELSNALQKHNQYLTVEDKTHLDKNLVIDSDLAMWNSTFANFRFTAPPPDGSENTADINFFNELDLNPLTKQQILAG
jgi:hypothetical protein